MATSIAKCQRVDSFDLFSCLLLNEVIIDFQVASENPCSNYKVVYVLGGPGSGKDTLCAKLCAQFGFAHLSVGELLDKEVASGSSHGSMIKTFKNQGKLLPTEMVINLLQKTMAESSTTKFLINGFPRSEENRIASATIMKVEPEFVLFLECSKEVMIARALSRNQGRSDDNEETMAKRLKVFSECTTPVLDHYSSKGKLCKINAEKSKEEVFEEAKSCFLNFGF
ncbi:hypothetical protein Leryth_015884 [Lithospermum erythrorhizon]|nr:hypothetical protein Leryth_015884 [Lithospermum erythrorhizon]